MIDYVRQGLDSLPIGMDSVLVSPSGSFLDTWEVPLDARNGILALLSQNQYPVIAFETRAETITEESIADCRSRIPEQMMRVYCGLESADPWVSQFSINKALEPDAFVFAMKTLAKYNMAGVANVLLGAPFLSEVELIEDAVQSIQWALAVGAKEFCLFPCHVKRWTQLEWLYGHGHYHPPSLWSFIEVLHRLGSQVVSLQGEIAWFTNYGAFNILASPTTCSVCYAQIIEQLHGFANSSDYTFIDRVYAIDCKCKEDWQEKLQTHMSNSREERAAMAYDQIGHVLYSDAWPMMRENVLTTISLAQKNTIHAKKSIFYAGEIR
jgi:radical SAM enzyme (TIGR01210 family)